MNEIESDLTAFQDIKNIKQWLKTYQRRSTLTEMDMPFGPWDEDGRYF